MFLYGMSMLASGLERASGGRLERTLEKMTDTVIKGVALGALVTAAIQSSSATTVIVVGLVNAQVLKLRNAIGVIMGANIGTTITAHILRLSDLQTDNFFLMLFAVFGRKVRLYLRQKMGRGCRFAGGSGVLLSAAVYAVAGCRLLLGTGADDCV